MSQCLSLSSDRIEIINYECDCSGRELNNSSINKDNEQDKNQKKIVIDTFANGRGHFDGAPINPLSANERQGTRAKGMEQSEPILFSIEL